MLIKSEEPALAWSPPNGYVALPSAVEGIEVYGPAPEAEHEDLETFTCRFCGGAVTYSASQRALTCPYCGRFQQIDADAVGRAADEYEFTVDAMASPERGWGEDRQEIACESCGAVVAVAPNALANTCAFCGSHRVLARASRGEVVRPTALIPFTVAQDAVRAVVSEWLGRGWMRPPELRNAGVLRELVGVYLPYWTFDAAARAEWQAEVGRPKTVRYRHGGQWRTRVEVVWRWRSGQVRRRFNDHLVPGTDHVSRPVLESVGPFNLGHLVEYDAGYLAGWQAHRYDVELAEAWETAKSAIREAIRRDCYADSGSAYVRNFKMSVDFADERWRHVLLPVYLCSYKFADQGYQVIVNGLNGQVAGQKPVDWRKVWLVIAATFAPGACLGLVGLLTLPLGGVGGALLAVAFFLLAVALIAGIVIFNRARSTEQG
jgi:predicted RNA-binding Zn-ribbon protein involved in translation (DUF1610 family)